MNMTLILIGDNMINIILRTLFFYFFIIFAYRIMGKREVGQLGIIDLIVSILIAEFAAISIENLNSNILNTIIPIVILVLLEVVLAIFNLKSRKFNRLFGGKPTMIIKEGKIIYNNMISQRYSLDDLLLELRMKEIDSIEDVKYAFLETNGKLSIYKYDLLKLNKNLPLPIIIEGEIQNESLNLINKNEKWLSNIINQNKLNLKNIFYAVYKNNKIFIIKKGTN